MSNFLAIATVTETLRQRLNHVVGQDLTGATATAMRPSTGTGSSNGLPNPGVNICLYQVNPNTAWRNADLPTRRSDGTAVQHSRVPLDLHYLLSFYGSEKQQEPQRVLGSVVRSLHSRSVLSHKEIQDAVKAAGFLAGSDLADEIELVKFTPLPLSLEEFSKIWSVFFQNCYTLSVAYQASVLFIEGKETTWMALPVAERKIHVMPFRQPVIETVQPQFVTAGERLSIQGLNLKADPVKVSLGSMTVVPDPDKITGGKIEVDLPQELRSGVIVVQVIQDLDLGTPEEPHRGFESNLGVFVLRPTITVTTDHIEDIVENGVPLKQGEIIVNFSPKVGKDQRVVLLLNQFDPPFDVPGKAFSFAVPPGNGIVDPETEAASVTIPFKIRKSDEGTYVVRVRVDDAESYLATDPLTGKYKFPQVTV